MDSQLLLSGRQTYNKQAISNIPPNVFIPLILAIMKRDQVRHCTLAERTGFSPSKISRILSCKRPIDTNTVYMMFNALSIDLMRALLAVGHFGDWEQYFDLDVELISDLIEVLPSSLSKARSGEIRAKISQSGTLVLAERLSHMIATNDREIARRQLEHPIEGI